MSTIIEGAFRSSPEPPDRRVVPKSERLKKKITRLRKKEKEGAFLTGVDIEEPEKPKPQKPVPPKKSNFIDADPHADPNQMLAELDDFIARRKNDEDDLAELRRRIAHC